MSFSKFFSRIQETQWYDELLRPVIKTVNKDSRILDIGTGPAKLLELLVEEKNVDCTGLDTNKDMLHEAKLKLGKTDIELVHVNPGDSYPFKNETFDDVILCSILFNLKDDAFDQVFEESIRVTKQGGRLIILTPTGNGSTLRLATKFAPFKNRSMFTWQKATKSNAKKWAKADPVAAYASKNNMDYSKEAILYDFAQLETLQIPVK